MTRSWHPSAADIQAYVDAADQAPDNSIGEHVLSCPSCRATAGRLLSAPAEPPDDDVLESIVAAGAGLPSPAALFAAFNSEPPQPAPGQVWQMYWDADVLVGLLAEVTYGAITVWPATLDVRLADEAALIIEAGVTPITDRFACWPAHATTAGWFTLATCLAALPSIDVAAVHSAWRAGGSLPAGVQRGPERPADHPCRRASAALADVAASIGAASWRDPQWEAPPDHEPPRSLAEVLDARGLSASWLAELLDVTPRQAIALCRGARELTAEQHDRLADTLGLTQDEAPTIRPDPQVLDALERPALRGLLRAVAAAEGTHESAVRRSFVSFRAAARQLEHHDQRDVTSQVRVELARRLDAARTTGAP